jgi:hypothetical protein
VPGYAAAETLMRRSYIARVNAVFPSITRAPWCEACAFITAAAPQDVAKRQHLHRICRPVAEKTPSAEKSGKTIVSAYKIAISPAWQRNCECVVILESDVAYWRLFGRVTRLDEDTQGAAFIGRAENWEAGRNPALPPQRWWSETSAKGHWRNPGRRRDGPKGQLQSPETSLVTKLLSWLRRAAGERAI